MGFEPTTTTLATWCSTPELLPLGCPTATPMNSAVTRVTTSAARGKL